MKTPWLIGLISGTFVVMVGIIEVSAIVDAHRGRLNVQNVFCPEDHVRHRSDTCDVAVGKRACAYITTGSFNICIGDDTQIPTPTTNFFVNIDNRLCFDRRTGERLPCPTVADLLERGATVSGVDQ